MPAQPPSHTQSRPRNGVNALQRVQSAFKRVQNVKLISETHVQRGPRRRIPHSPSLIPSPTATLARRSAQKREINSPRPGLPFSRAAGRRGWRLRAARPGAPTTLNAPISTATSGSGRLPSRHLVPGAMPSSATPLRPPQWEKRIPTRGLRANALNALSTQNQTDPAAGSHAPSARLAPSNLCAGQRPLRESLPATPIGGRPATAATTHVLPCGGMCSHVCSPCARHVLACAPVCIFRTTRLEAGSWRLEAPGPLTPHASCLHPATASATDTTAPHRPRPRSTTRRAGPWGGRR